MTVNFSGGLTPVHDKGELISVKSKGNSSVVLSDRDMNANSKAKHLLSTGSIQSQSSNGSSSISTIQGLKEINKVILAKNANPRKELLSNRDNKVYSYKLNQLISIIKSSQSGNKKTSKKKVPPVKPSSVSVNKKTCRKMTKTNRKLPKKSGSKTSVNSKKLYVVNFIQLLAQSKGTLVGRRRGKILSLTSDVAKSP